MKSHARVVIIGGGVAGTSTLYHLAERGWTDCMLLEMDELTSGSTWHAAGNIPTFSSSRNVIKLQHYSTKLYARLCEDPVYPINYHQTGSIRLAHTEQRMEEFRHVSAMANAMGLEYEVLDLATMKARHPFLQDHDLRGALWDPADGDIDPSQLTQALATHARRAGAIIHRFTRVTGVSRTAGGEWKVQTDKGDVLAEYVVNAGGYRGAEVTQLGGRFLPMVTLEHQYLVTESIPELEAGEGLLPLVRDPDDSYYLRQEKTGLILGPYEKQATARWQDGRIPESFAYELYPDDLERLEWYIEKACERMPILGSVGVQRVINGPIPYSPDGLPYIGPAYGLPNFFHVNGFSFGICQGGGAGKSTAEWIIDGKPEWDLWSLDPRRYTDYADQDYVVDRAIELYQHEYAINYPVEERPAGRPRKLTPCYDTLKAKGARFGARGGWERATWFAPVGFDAEEVPSYQRGVWFESVGQECRHVRDAVGVLDLGGFTRLELKGEGSSQWLDSLIAGRLPKSGRVALSYFCAPDGGVWSEMTLTRLDDEHYWLISAAAAKWHDQQWLQQHLPQNPASQSSALELTDISDDYGTLVVAGPRSREVLQSLTQADLSNESFRWLSCRSVKLAGIEVQALRVNYVGELGWELHVPVARQLALYEALMEAGSSFGIRDFGMYAMESMRLEKSYRAWKVELDHEYSPLRSGLSRFVDLHKPAFIGREALLAEAAAELPDVFATFVLDDTITDAAEAADAERIANTDALYGCPVLDSGKVVGYTTSGGFGHRIGKSVALGYIRPDLAVAGTSVQINVLGHLRLATVVAESPYDPDNTALRG